MRRPGRPSTVPGIVIAVLSVLVATAMGTPAGPRALAAGPTVMAAHVHVDNYRNAVFTGFWSLPEASAAAEAVLCWLPDATPASPETAAACSVPGRFVGTLQGLSLTGPFGTPEPVTHF